MPVLEAFLGWIANVGCIVFITGYVSALTLGSLAEILKFSKLGEILQQLISD